MVRLALQLAYDGANYRGWTDLRDTTLRPTLGKVLFAGNTEANPLIEAASRTDAGVHAQGQVCSLLIDAAPPNLGQLQYSLNQLLPPDVSVRNAALVADGLDVRSNVGKTYIYRLSTLPGCHDPLARHYEWHVPSRRGRPPWDAARASALAERLCGAHSFGAFGNTPRGRERAVAVDPRCTLHELHLAPTPMDDFGNDLHPAGRRAAAAAAERWTFTVRGDRFLYKMVRNLVGALVKVGHGELSSDEVLEALEAGSFARSASLPLTAPAQGLVLQRVNYADGDDPFQQDLSEHG